MTTVQFKTNRVTALEHIVGVKSITESSGRELIQVINSLVERVSELENQNAKLLEDVDSRNKYTLQRINDLERFSNLSGLIDVNISNSVKDGDVLSWDSSRNKWSPSSLE